MPRPRRRKQAGIALAALAVAAVLVAIGRWERARHADEEMAGMRRVVQAVGPLDSAGLAGFRYFRHFQCLAYERPQHRIALELCVDPDGRVVEAIDRRSGEPEIWSLREDPTASEVRVDRRTVDRLLVRMGVPPRLIREAHKQGST
jgi:hypothetical protein